MTYHTTITAAPADRDTAAPAWPHNVTKQTSGDEFVRLIDAEAYRLFQSVRRPAVVERMLIAGDL